MTDHENRLEALLRHRNHYTLVNALLRRGDDRGLRSIGYTAEQIAKLKEPDLLGRQGYEGQIRNTAEKIRRLRRRMKGAA